LPHEMASTSIIFAYPEQIALALPWRYRSERTTIGSEFRLRIKWHGLIRDKNVPFTQLADI
jgi:hypothetical protein